MSNDQYADMPTVGDRWIAWQRSAQLSNQRRCPSGFASTARCMHHCRFMAASPVTMLTGKRCLTAGSPVTLLAHTKRIARPTQEHLPDRALPASQSRQLPGRTHCLLPPAQETRAGPGSVPPHGSMIIQNSRYHQLRTPLLSPHTHCGPYFVPPWMRCASAC